MSAHQAPAAALVRLYLYLRDHGHFESGFERGRCEAEAERLLKALPNGPPFPVTHPAAALRAIDRFILEARDFGLANEQVKIVEVPAEEGGGRYWLVQRRPGWWSRLAMTQAGHREYWMRGHQVVPALHDGIGIAVGRPQEPLWRLLATPTRFAAGGFLDGIEPDWIQTRPYRCRRLLDPEGRWSSVQAALDQAAAEGASIVLLPELTVDPEVRQRLRRWLRERRDHPFALVVAGSFHEPRTDGAEGAGRGVARVFDAWGDEVLAHVKLRPMRAMPKGEVVDEDLEGGRQLDLLFAPFGLLALAICLDFCEGGDTAVADLWKKAGPGLMLVPSMGDDHTNNAHRRRAQELALQHATVTVVASQELHGNEALGLCWRPGNGLEEPLEESEGSPFLHHEWEWRTLDSTGR